MSRERFMWYHALMSSPMKVDNVWLTTIAGIAYNNISIMHF